MANQPSFCAASSCHDFSLNRVPIARWGKKELHIVDDYSRFGIADIDHLIQ